MQALAALRSVGLVALALVSLAGCTTTTPEVSPMQTEEDKAWAMNVPGQAHTHIVRLPGCSEKLLSFTHVHRPDQNYSDAGPVGWHKHNGCFQCPPKNAQVKRILSH